MSNYPTPPQNFSPYPPPEYPMLPVMPAKGPRQYGIFGAMVRAPFFNGNLYRDVARNWGGIGFWYLFLLELITWTILLVKIHVAITAFAVHDFPRVVKDVPPITVTNGHVTSPVEQPYFINDPDTGKAMAVLDTTGKINSLDDTDAMLVITDHKVFMRQDKAQSRQYDLSTVKNFYLDKTKLSGWMNMFSHLAAITMLPLLVIVCLIGRLIVVLIYGGFNMVFSSMFGANLTFGGAMRLAVIAVTPIILLDTILELFAVNIPFWTLLGICISLLYMAMAVRANATPMAPPPGFPVVMPT